MRILIVRLGSLGDVIHTLPAVAALRRAMPDARIDWLVDKPHQDIVGLVTAIDARVVLEARTLKAWLNAAAVLRARRYDAALDFQGLFKSALLARASGAKRVLGFSIWHLRERGARAFYSETSEPDKQRHVMRKNLALAAKLAPSIDQELSPLEFPLAAVPSAAVEQLKRALGGAPYAVLNPGAAWPNKRWPPERFGEVAAFLRARHGLRSVVAWGPGEKMLAEAVVSGSEGAAVMSPALPLIDLAALLRDARLMVSGDTGPTHIAGALGVPIVSPFGPTNPARNGPWDPADIVVSKFDECECHSRRGCRVPDRWCLGRLPASEMMAAITRRLDAVPR
ncbi:MAG TPA: lipopolysaccharide heptosyltransferase I [Vicinamibacterales bacterium]|nr:lipopolysaccharide heptosyltransferase I [Vicinamibacterales bacterium]